jgi:hypothetical protein
MILALIVMEKITHNLKDKKFKCNALKLQEKMDNLVEHNCDVIQVVN